MSDKVLVKRAERSIRDSLRSFGFFEEEAVGVQRGEGAVHDCMEFRGGKGCDGQLNDGLDVGQGGRVFEGADPGGRWD